MPRKRKTPKPSRCVPGANFVSPKEPTPHHKKVSPRNSSARHDVTEKHADQSQSDSPAESKLDKLPAELLYEIDDYLDNDGALAFRVTCVRIREVLLYYKPRTEEVRKGVAKENPYEYPVRHNTAKERLHLRLVNDAIRAEEEGRTYPGKMQVCGVCSDFHDKIWFSVEQLSAPPRVRACYRRERRFRICEHTDMTYYELLKLPNRKEWVIHWETDWRHRSCEIYLRPRASVVCSCNVWIMKTLSLQARLPRQIGSLMFTTKLHQKFLPGWERKWAPHSRILGVREQVYMALTRGGYVICPHLQETDLCRRKLRSFCTAIMKDRANSEPSIQFTCENELCGAVCELSWNPQRNYMWGMQSEGAVHVKILRKVKEFDVEGPGWWLTVSEPIELDQIKVLMEREPHLS